MYKPNHVSVHSIETLLSVNRPSPAIYFPTRPPTTQPAKSQEEPVTLPTQIEDDEEQLILSREEGRLHHNS